MHDESSKALGSVNYSLLNCEAVSGRTQSRTAVVERLETGIFWGLRRLGKLTESMRFGHRGEMLAQAALAGVSAFCLSAFAAAATDSMSLETTVVLRPGATIGFVASAARSVESAGFAVIARPAHLGNARLPLEVERSANDSEIGQLPLKRPGMILHAREDVKTPVLRPDILEAIGTTPTKGTESPFAFETAAPQQPTDAIQVAVSGVPRMTRDVLLADALEAFAEGDYSGHSDDNWEFASSDLSELPDRFEKLAGGRDDSFGPAPVLRPHYFDELQCLAEAIYFEARGEKRVGQQAVAEVIIKRVKSDKFPDKICEVVMQGGSNRHRCQFSYNCDGLPESISEKDTYAEVRMLAFQVLQGEIKPVAGGATYFHTTSANPRWARKFEKTVEIGSHVFYQEQIN